MRGNHPCWSPSDDGDGGGARIDADALVGELLVNRYRIEEAVAQGPVATVFRARDDESDRDVAVKLLEPVIDPEGETARSMVADVEKAADIQHSSLVPVTEIGLHQGETIFLVEPFVAAETVADRLADDGPFKPRVAMRIAREVFDALTALHSHGLVHLNIKPENIFLVRDAMGTERAVLSGTALHHVMGLSEASQRDPSGCRARPEYISPEAVSGRPMDLLSDVYLTGLVLYEMLCGRPAFSGSDFRKTARRHAIERPLSPRIVRRQAQISKALDALVMRCLEKTSSRRFGSAEEASLELAQIANSDDSSRNRTSLNFRPVSTEIPPSVEAVDSGSDEEPDESSEIPPEAMETSRSMEAIDSESNSTSSDEEHQQAPEYEPPVESPTPDPSADTDDAVAAVEEPKIIVTDPKMRAMTQPLVSSATRSPEQGRGSTEEEPEGDNQTIRLSSSHDGEPAPTPAHFRETGQWFVESVEELEAHNPHLAELEELNVPKDRNLLPWVMGALALVVIAVFTFSEEPEEPAWKTRLNSAKKTVDSQSAPQAKTIASKGAAATTANQGDAAAPIAKTAEVDASIVENREAKFEQLAKAVRAAISSESWTGSPTSAVATLDKIRALDPKHPSLKTLTGEVNTKLLAQANSLLKAGDLSGAAQSVQTALTVVPESVVAQKLLNSITVAEKRAAAKAAAESASRDRATQEANAKKAAAKAAADKAAAKAAAAKAAAAKAAAAKAAAAKASAAKAAAAKAAAAKATAKRAAVAKAAAAKAAAAKAAAAKRAAAKRAAMAKASAKRPAPKRPAPKGPSAKELVREGNTHIKNARWSDASKAFKAALRQRKSSAAAHSGLGQVAFQKGKFKEAVSHHSRSVRYASKNASFRVNLALAYFKTKSFAQAKKACEAALKIQPSNAKAKRYLKVINKKLKK